MAVKQNGMKPQDIVVLLKKMTHQGQTMLNKDIAASLSISASEVSEALERCRVASLIDESKKEVRRLALMEFLVHGLKYVFPVAPGGMVRGVPTAISASPMKEAINNSDESFVWPSKNGRARGQAITPLYPTVPLAVQQDAELYKLLAIVDSLRIGRAREAGIAKQKLEELFSNNMTAS